MNLQALLSLTFFAGALLAYGDTHDCLAQYPVEFSTIQEVVPEATSGEIEHLAVDVARRTLLAYQPHASRYPVRTLELRVRPEGDLIHSYVKLEWVGRRGFKKCNFTSEVYSSFIYTSELRRIYDLDYEDNTLISKRICPREIEILSAANKAFDQGDPVQMPVPLVSNRLSVMPPRQKSWSRQLLQGERGWHVYQADDYIDPDWVDSEPPVPTE